MGLAAGATCAAGMPISALAAPLEPRRVALQNLHTGEALNAVYWENGKYVPDAVAALNKVLRDFRTGDVHMIDPGLYDILDAISAKVENRKQFQIISGYRSPKTNTMLKKTGGGGVATHSLHMEGEALDIRLDGVALNNVHKAALSLKRGGVGLYPVSNFVHVDVGRVRQWNGV
jgi:uncharacterized protein YcbK (DUF882 family)